MEDCLAAILWYSSIFVETKIWDSERCFKTRLSDASDIKLCTRPTKTQKEIFDALNFKHRPYVRKTKVVPQL